MTYIVSHRYGGQERDFPKERFPELLDELADDDPEHPDVSVTHGDWCLAIMRGGTVFFENLEENEPVHLRGLSHQDILALMEMVADGRIDEVRARPWNPGYPK